MDPFALIGLGAALMFVIQWARGEIDLNEPSDHSTSSPSEPARKKSGKEKPSSTRNGTKRKSTGTIRRSTQLLTDDERDEAAESIRKAARKRGL